MPPSSPVVALKHGRHGAFAIVLIAGFMTLLDVSIVNVALPSIEQALHANAPQVQWIVAGYALTFGLLLVAAGRAGDIFGRRLLFIIGVGGFFLSSLGCGLAPTADVLTIFRLVQGAFAGVLNPQVLGLIQDLFAGKERAKAFGTYGMMVGVSTATGPLLGGMLISAFGPEHGWRFVFLINVPIGLILLPLAYRWLPRVDRSTRRKAPAGGLLRQFDPMAIVLLGLIVLAIMWPFLEVSESRDGTFEEAPFWLIGVAVVLILALYVWEKFWSKRALPLIDSRLLKDPGYVLGVGAGLTYFAGFTSIFVVMTMYLQQGVGFTALQAGLAQMPFALASGVSAFIAGRLVNRFGRNVPIVGSTAMMLCVFAIAVCARLVPESSLPLVVIVLLGVAGVASGLVISPNQALTLADVPSEMAGVAAALLQTMQRVGTAIGLAVVTTVFFMSVATEGYTRALAASMALIGSILSVTWIVNIADRLRRHDSTKKTIRKINKEDKL